jgi:hypothetical protein
MGYNDEPHDMSEAGETGRTMTPRRLVIIVGSLIIFWLVSWFIILALLGWYSHQ